jgi:hypothetical protein
MLGGSKAFRYLARLLLFTPPDKRMRPTPRRFQLRLGPVAIVLTAGAIVVFGGLAVNGCRISKLLSSSNTPPGTSEGGAIIVVPSVVRDSAIAGTSDMRKADVAVTNGGRWGTSTDDPWIHVSPANGGSRATLRISLDPKELTPGLHRGAVILQEEADTEVHATVSVDFLIQQPVLAIDPDKFDYRPSNSNTVFRDTIAVTNKGTGPLVWTVTTENHADWLTFETDTTGTAPSLIAIRASNAGLSYFGTYKETIVVSSPGAKNSPQSIEVTMRRKRGGHDDDGTP